MAGLRGAASIERGSAVRPSRLDDAQLLARIADRDLRAFERLYRAYHPRLSRFVSNILRRPHLVEEVLNDTMMVVWRRPGAYNGTSRVSTWIFAIAYRTALKALRRADDPVPDDRLKELPSSEPDPEQHAERGQAQRDLLAAIVELSPDHRAVIDLTYFHELGYAEIAEIMGCPVGTVKTRMFHARRHLRQRLAGCLAD
ncbi:MAG TPA: sigma-70 family RNA polymerase sigma factor [Caulobacteraceae bacterium]|jgi:RNA polymerase sigma-70 factor (ECF subfamily)|nr:sigma-70 family RNA polymerase sigma factor [Caulobacteraceae bacterium]